MPAFLNVLDWGRKIVEAVQQNSARGSSARMQPQATLRAINRVPANTIHLHARRLRAALTGVLRAAALSWRSARKNPGDWRSFFVSDRVLG